MRWSPSKIKPPSKLVIYPGEEEGVEPIRTIDLDPGQAEMSLDLEASLPADAMFTLASSFKPGHWEEGERQRLFFTFSKVTINFVLAFSVVFYVVVNFEVGVVFAIVDRFKDVRITI